MGPARRLGALVGRSHDELEATFSAVELGGAPEYRDGFCLRQRSQAFP
jgi:hypothetical protein